MKRTGRKLKTGLYGIPILLVFFMALTIFIAFNLVVNGYVARLAERNIASRFEWLDAYYLSSQYGGYYDENSDFIITVRHMIFDDAGKLLYPYSPWESEAEQVQTEMISARYENGSLLLRDGKGQTLALGKNTYYVMQRNYTGQYDGAFISKSAPGRVYRVLVYMDITPIADFLRMLTCTLLALIAGLSLLTAALLLSAGRGLDHSFQTLKSYILRIGERKEAARAGALPYAEFNEITEAVFQMSGMIEAAEAAQMKFFQNASHELRTPLTAIRGYAEGLHAGVIRDTKASAAIIMEHSDKMSALVDDLLYASKLDAQREAAGDKAFDLRETVNRCAWAIAGKAKSADMRLTLHTDETPLFLTGSEEMIERALSNILTNALRYACTEIVVSLTAAEGNAVVTIEDDGEGISQEDLPHIFERFYKGRGGVTGIGLSITQEAVRRHRGTVTAQSSDGYTVFTVTLPLKNR